MIAASSALMRFIAGWQPPAVQGPVKAKRKRNSQAVNGGMMQVMLAVVGYRRNQVTAHM
jgi:hypothetical protein